MEISILDEHIAAHVAELFRSFSDTSRVRLLSALTVQEMNVGALAKLIGISESAVSHHLRSLRHERLDDTVVLATACTSDPREGIDFFPLTVDYVEKFYAAGRIPGGFFKREGRPSEKETLTSRLIDRPIRPLFPKGFLNEVLVCQNVYSADNVNDPDILSINAASAAIHSAPALPTMIAMR